MLNIDEALSLILLTAWWGVVNTMEQGERGGWKERREGRENRGGREVTQMVSHGVGLCDEPKGTEFLY